jgi:hypothetical protein
MQASPEVRQKLVAVIGNLICRCIEEACAIPYILGQEQVLEILVGNPDRFAELIRDEHHDKTEYAHDRLTAKIDAVTELGQFEALNAFDTSFAGGIESEADLEQVLGLINRLTRTFMVYTGNTMTIFEKEFQLFMEKLRQSLLQAGEALQAIELNPADTAGLEKKAEEYLCAGQFLQAFSCERLLNAEIITRELVRLPVSGEDLKRRLVKRGLSDVNLRSSLVRFILRACYISQGGWQDLFDTLVELADQEPEICDRSLLTDQIEQDGVFCCNLLGDSLANLKKWPAAEIRQAIENKLAGRRHLSRES